MVVHRGQVITQIWPGFHDRAYGLAVDVGSTTVAAHLCHLSTGEVLASSGIMNPQIRFGEDLMSRVSYVMMNPGGRHELTTAVHRVLDELVGELRSSEAARPGVGGVRPGEPGRPVCFPLGGPAAQAIARRRAQGALSRHESACRARRRRRRGGRARRASRGVCFRSARGRARGDGQRPRRLPAVRLQSPPPRVLGVGRRTVERDWRYATTWIYHRLEGSRVDGEDAPRGS